MEQNICFDFLNEINQNNKLLKERRQLIITAKN